MTETAYSTALWGNEYVPNNSVTIGDGSEATRITATSDGHLSDPQINISEIKVIKVSPYSMDYYSEGPYLVKEGTSLEGLISWFLELEDVSDSSAKGTMNKLNLTYFMADSYYTSEIKPSIMNKKNNIYNNGRISIWPIN
jgi:hypothetical protein